MVRYADDFVILCRTQAEAEAALHEVQAWVAENGLTLHPDKTRIGDCRQPGRGFDFLGYRFEAGRRLVRKKSLKALKDKVRAERSVAGATASGGSSTTSTRCFGDGLATSSMPRQACSASSTASSADGCAPSCASRRSAPASGDARPITNAGPMPSSLLTGCSPFAPPSQQARHSR